MMNLNAKTAWDISNQMTSSPFERRWQTQGVITNTLRNNWLARTSNAKKPTGLMDFEHPYLKTGKCIR